MRVHLVLAAAVAGAASATPVMAQDRTWHRAITAQEYGKAERRLVAERRFHPERPDLMLNLAAVYLRTGRAMQARALYDEVLAAAPVAMDMPSGRVLSSHAVASVALAGMERGRAFASR